MAPESRWEGKGFGRRPLAPALGTSPPSEQWMALGAKLWGLPMPRGQRNRRAGGDLGSSDGASGICHLNKGEQLCNMRILDNDLQGRCGGTGGQTLPTRPLPTRPQSQQPTCSSPLSSEGAPCIQGEPDREGEE